MFNKFDLTNFNIDEKGAAHIFTEKTGCPPNAWFRISSNTDMNKEETMRKPKFSKGDWITNGENTLLITNVHTLDYDFKRLDGTEAYDTVDHVDKNFHLWTLDDAKDGDILYLKENYDDIEWLILFEKVEDEKIFDNFALATTSKSFFNGDFWGCLDQINVIRPTQQEERKELLDAINNNKTEDYNQSTANKLNKEEELTDFEKYLYSVINESPVVLQPLYGNDKEYNEKLKECTKVYGKKLFSIAKKEIMQKVTNWLFNHNDYITVNNNCITMFDMNKCIEDLEKHIEK